jgi:hypothetical protein
MAEDTQELQATAPAATEGAPAEGEKQSFIPFFNPEYEFRLGALGDMSIAYRLAAIFLFMLFAAAMMYIGSVWWVERRNQDAAADPAPVTYTASTQDNR